MSKGIPIVISAPSGAGKSTIAQRIAKKRSSTVLSISCTTRPARSGEKNGKDYFFIEEQDFKRKIDAGDFLEWAVVHGFYYGTPLSYLQTQMDHGSDVLLTIDPQGAMAVKRIYKDGVYIFVVPPSWDILMKRLVDRATEDAKTMEIRIANARKELSYLSHYDYLIVNDDLEEAIEQISSIITAEHLKLSRVNRNEISILAKTY
jgi:guanylate kinase